MKLSPYRPNITTTRQTVTPQPMQTASNPRFGDSSSDGAFIFSLPFIIGGVGVVLTVSGLLAYLTSRSSNRNRVIHDSSDWHYHRPRDTFELSNRPHRHRDPVIVHRDWDHSDDTITSRYDNVVLEHIRRPEPALTRADGSAHAERQI